MKRVICMGNALVDVLARVENDDVLTDLSLSEGAMQLVDDERFCTVRDAMTAYATEKATGGSAANTALRGRWQKLGEAPLTVCDTGHNAHGIAYVAEQLRQTPHRKLYCVMGFVRDKDLAHILPLLPREAHYLFTQAHTERALTAEELTAKAAIYGLQGEAVADVQAAVARARELAAPEDMIFIGGSTYVVGEAL